MQNNLYLGFPGCLNGKIDLFKFVKGIDISVIMTTTFLLTLNQA